MGDVGPYHHAYAVQQWRHRLTACVKASGEHFARSRGNNVNQCMMYLEQREILFLY